MSLAVYNLSLFLYSLAAKLISPFNSKAGQWVNGRKYVWEELARLQKSNERVWIHCSSLGEYEQAFPLVQVLKASYEVVITFFSPSGYEIVKKKDASALVFYLPIDSKTNASKFLDIVNPQLAIFVRYDLWHYYLHELQKRKIETILISAVYSKDSIFFKRFGRFFLNMLKCFTRIFVQDENSKSLLEEYGFENVSLAGDTRVDRVSSAIQQAQSIPGIEEFRGEKKLVIIGSLEPKDHDVVIPVINDLKLRHLLKFVIAPHHVDSKSIGNLVEKIAGSAVLFSELASKKTAEVLIINEIGKLFSLYQYADFVYVGGGFGEGLHNTLEPASWGKPILFGPRYQKFLEAEELIKTGAAFSVETALEMKKQIQHLLSDSENLQEAGANSKEFIEQRTGATKIISDYLATLPVQTNTVTP